MHTRSLGFAFACSLSLLAACGGAPPPPAAAPTPVASAPSVAKPEAADPKAKQAAALDALVAGEAAKGACDPAHESALEKLLGEVEAGMKAKAQSDGKPIGFTLVAKRVLALGAQARSIELAGTARGTEVHVLAFGVHGVSLDVLVGKAAATTLRSPHQRTARSPLSIELPTLGVVDELESDSRQVTLEPNQPIVVKLTGEGCVAMAAFLKP